MTRRMVERPVGSSGLGRVRSSTSSSRSPLLPDVPTMAEAGYPGVGTTLWAGLFAPAATPAPVLETLMRMRWPRLKT